MDLARLSIGALLGAASLASPGAATATETGPFARVTVGFGGATLFHADGPTAGLTASAGWTVAPGIALHADGLYLDHLLLDWDPLCDDATDEHACDPPGETTRRHAFGGGGGLTLTADFGTHLTGSVLYGGARRVRRGEDGVTGRYGAIGLLGLGQAWAIGDHLALGVTGQVSWGPAFEGWVLAFDATWR